ncbi:MAG: BF3164 family lipoprotein [Bacteroidia bacterium]|nr:BF3164 family lipoprotein [Bacteroidia bacterium]
MFTIQKITALSFSILILLSCGNRKTIKTDSPTDTLIQSQQVTSMFPALEAGVVKLTDKDFGDMVELKGTPVATEAIFKPNELEMIIKDEMLIMKTSGSAGLIKFLSIPDLKLIREVGTKGQGPGELLYPMLISTSEPGLLCYLYDMQLEKVYQIDTAFIMKETGFRLEKKENQLFGSKQFVETGSRQFYYASNSTTGKGIYRYMADQPDSVKLVYDVENGFKKNLGWSALIGDFGGNREKNRLVYAYKYFHQIRFFDLLSGNTRTIRFDAAGNDAAGSPDARDVLAPTSVTHHWGISPQPDYLYCIYSGRTPIEVNDEFKAGTDHIFIEQYDWNGKPVKKYRLDHWGYFCVDEARRTIYVAAVSADEAMYRYRY